MNLDKVISKENQKKLNTVLIFVCLLIVLYMMWRVFGASEKMSNTDLAQEIIDIKNAQDPRDSGTLPGASKIAKLIFA